VGVPVGLLVSPGKVGAEDSGILEGSELGTLEG
jgi:hypothetical protein